MRPYPPGDIHAEAARRQWWLGQVRSLLTSASVVVGFVAFAYLLMTFAGASRRREEADQLRYWQFQAQQVAQCRAAGGFPVEQLTKYGASESAAFVSCSFPPRCP